MLRLYGIMKREFTRKRGCVTSVSNRCYTRPAGRRNVLRLRGIMKRVFTRA